MTQEEKVFLAQAANFFENPGLFIKGVNLLAVPLEKAQRALPKPLQNKLSKAVQLSLEKALSVSLKTLSKETGRSDLKKGMESSSLTSTLHGAATGVTGALGGLFGAPALIVELPISTMVMLRSIAKIAQDFGEDLSDPQSVLECLVVFGFGGPKPDDDLSDTAYYSLRWTMAAGLREASAYLAGMPLKEAISSLERGTAPQLLRFLEKIAALFEVRMTKKLAAQVFPVIGAAGGAAINVAFSHFFNQSARYHFGIRQLEKKYGADLIQKEFRNSLPR